MPATIQAYAIRNWSAHFENHESKKLKNLTWIPMPNKHDGRGYRRVAALPNSVRVFCAWPLMLQVASKTPTRGVLLDEDGALTAADLAAKTGFPEGIFADAFTALIRPEIRWLELVEVETSGDSPGIARNPPHEGKGMEGNRTEGVGNAPSLKQAQTYFSLNGSDYGAAEVKNCWLSFEANKDEAGQWYWGKRLVGDWRAAMESRMSEARMKRQPKKPKSQPI